MTSLNKAITGLSTNAKVLLVCAAVILTAFAGLVLITGSEGTSDNHLGGTITYLPGDDLEPNKVQKSTGGDAERVSISTYYGIKSTEYNPEYWSGWGEVSSSTPNWIGPAYTPEADSNWYTLTITFTGVIDQAYQIDLSNYVVAINSGSIILTNLQANYTPPESDGAQVLNGDILCVKCINGTDCRIQLSVQYKSNLLNKVFGGWEIVTGTGVGKMIYPGDVVPWDVTEVKAIWLEPNLYAVKAVNISQWSGSNPKTVDTLDIGWQSYRIVEEDHIYNQSNPNLTTYFILNITPSTCTDKYVAYSGNNNDSSDSARIFTEIYHLHSFRYQLLNDNNKSTTFTEYNLTAGSTIPIGTYRSDQLGSPATIKVNGICSLDGDVIFDNLKIGTATLNGKHGDGLNGLYANGHRLIMGVNLVNVGKIVVSTSTTTPAPQIYGGAAQGNIVTPIEEDKTIVTGRDDVNPVVQDIGTFIIVHSGIYNNVVAGCNQGNVGVAGVHQQKLSTYMVLKNCIVADTVIGGGGATNGTRSNIYGANYADEDAKASVAQKDKWADLGGTYIYALGLFTPGDDWEDYQCGYDDYETGSDSATFEKRGNLSIDESSIVEGGSSRGTIRGASHIFLSGKSSVWDIQAGGRNGETTTDYTYLEITGKAEVRRVACGTITDGLKSGSADTTFHSHVYVGGDASVANVYGAGFDTWAYPGGVSMKQGIVDVDIVSGTVYGDVFGGGYRGTIGVAGSKFITVNVNIQGGIIKGDVYGGGSGGLNKVKHPIKNGTNDNKIGMGFQNAGDGIAGNWGSTGKSYVYGDVYVNVIGGTIEGNVYGGGMSVPKLDYYENLYSANNKALSQTEMVSASYDAGTGQYSSVNPAFFNYETVTENKQTVPCEVATVVGDVHVTVTGDALVYKSVYGAGKGIVTTKVNGVEVVDKSVYGFNNVLHYNSNTDGVELGKLYWTSSYGDIDGLPQYDYDNTVDYSNYAKVKGNIYVDVSTKKWALNDYVYEENSFIVSASYADEGKNIVLMSDDATSSSDDEKYTVIMVSRSNGEDTITWEKNVLSTGSVTLPSGTWYVKGTQIETANYPINKSHADVNRNIILYSGDLPTNYRVILIEGDDVRSVDATDGSTITLEMAIVYGSVYGGGGYSKVIGNTYVEVDSGRVDVNVYGGGLGKTNKVSTEGQRTVSIKGESLIAGSVYGGSEYGIDGKEQNITTSADVTDEMKNLFNRNKSLVVIEQGDISGSVFGGGLMGKTYGDTAVYIGYNLPNIILRSPVPNDYSDVTGTYITLDSVFAGGNVSTSGGDDSTIANAYTEYLVQGAGTVKIYGSGSGAIAIKGSLMGSGNACLTRGTTTMDLSNLYNGEQLTGIHRVDKLTIDSSVLKITGRSPVTKVFGQDATLSVYKIGELILKNGASIAFDSAIDDIGSLKSQTKEGRSTTPTSPINRLVYTAGSSVYIRSLDENDELKYNPIEGYILMISPQNNYGAYALGLNGSPGGFSVSSDGSLKEADTSITGTVCCWYISGIQKKVTTMNLMIQDLMGGKTVTESYIDITKFQADTSIIYTGGIFTKMSNDPNGDPYSFVRPGADSMEDNPAELSLAIGYNKTNESGITLYDPTSRQMEIPGSASTYNMGTFFKKDGIESDLNGEEKNRSLTSVPMLYSSQGRTSGEFRINLCLSGMPLDSTSYVGYVTLNFQEIKTVSYGAIGDSGGVTDTVKSLVASTIEVRIDIYIYGYEAAHGLKNDDVFTVEIKTSTDKEGVSSGSASTLIPQTYTMAELEVVSISTIGAGSGSMPNVSINNNEYYILPDCGYIAPTNKSFKCWKISSGSNESNFIYGYPGQKLIFVDAYANAQIEGYTAKVAINSQTLKITPVWIAMADIVYDLNGGTVTNAVSESVKSGIQYKLPDLNQITAPDGNHLFAKWSVTMGANKTVDKDPGEIITITGNTLIKAIWADKVTVTFTTIEGSGSMSNDHVASGERYTLPMCTFTEPTGKHFTKWTVTVSGQNSTLDKYPGESVKATGAISAKANWSDGASYSVTYNANGGSGAMGGSTIASGSSYQLKASTFTAPSDDKIFYKWNVSIGGMESEYDPGEFITITNTTVVKAIWVSKHAIAYQQGSSPSASRPITGSATSGADVAYGTQYSLSVCSWYGDGLTFVGWKDSVTNEIYYPGQVIDVIKNRTFIALWEVSSVNYKITYDPNGGTLTVIDSVVEGGTLYTLPDSGMTPPNTKLFLKWSVTSGNSEPADKQAGDVITITADTTIQAVWADPVTVTFNADGGTGSMGDVYTPSGGSYILPECTFTPPTSNYFLKWSVSIGGVSQEDMTPGSSVTASGAIVLTATWSTNAHTVTYNANGGSGTMEGSTIASGSSYQLKASTFTAPSNDVIFYKWGVTIGEAAEVEYDPGDFVVISDSTVVKAIWETEYTVTYAKGNYPASVDLMGLDVPSSTVAAGSDYRASACTWYGIGLTFVGWSDGNNTYAQGAAVTVSGDLTLTAQWLESTTCYRITFDPNGGIGYTTTLRSIETSYKLPNCDYTLDGKVFKSWRVGNASLQPGTVILLTQDILIKAEWEDVADSDVTIQFKASNNSDLISTIKINAGSTYILPENTFPSLFGYKVTWNVKSGEQSKTAALLGTIIINADGTVANVAGNNLPIVDHKLIITPVQGSASEKKLQFTDGVIKAGTVSITAKANGDNTTGWSNLGNSVKWDLSTGDFEDGCDAYIGTLLGNIIGNISFDVSNLSFIDSNGDHYYPTLDLCFDRSGVEAHTYLTFMDKQYYTISFIDRGLESRKTYEENTLLTRELCENPGGTNFSGWYLDSKFVNRYDYNLVVNDESDGLVLYARYTYVVTLDNMNGTTFTLHVSQEDNGALLSENDLPTPTYTGYTFKGWCKDKDLVYDWGYQSDKVTSDMTLYARWVGQDVRVYFWYQDEDGYTRLFEDGEYTVIIDSTTTEQAGFVSYLGKDSKEVVDLGNPGDGYKWCLVKYADLTDDSVDNPKVNLIPIANNTYTVSGDDEFSSTTNRIVIAKLAQATTVLNNKTVVFETKYGLVPTIQLSKAEEKIDLPSTPTGAPDSSIVVFKGWKVTTGNNPRIITASDSLAAGDYDHGVVIVKAIWEEKKFDLSRAYQFNADTGLYPTVRYGETFDVKDPYHANGAKSILKYAEDTIEFTGSFVKWIAISPLNSSTHVNIYEDTTVGNKVLKYVTEDMLKNYSDMWDYYMHNDDGYHRVDWVGDNKPETMEIHLVADTTKIAIKVSMGLKEEDEKFLSSVSIDDPEEFLVYPNGPDPNNKGAAEGTCYDEFGNLYHEGTKIDSEVMFYWNADYSIRYYYNKEMGCWECLNEEDAKGFTTTFSKSYIKDEHHYIAFPKIFTNDPNNPKMQYRTITSEDEYGTTLENSNIKSIAYRIENGEKKTYLVEWGEQTQNNNEFGVIVYYLYAGETEEKSGHTYMKWPIDSRTDNMDNHLTGFFVEDDAHNRYQVTGSSTGGMSIQSFSGNYYEFKYTLNSAVRSGYTLSGWHNDYVSITNSLNPSSDLERTVKVTIDRDGYIKTAKLYTQNNSGVYSEIPLLVGNYVVDQSDANADGSISVVSTGMTPPSDYTVRVVLDKMSGGQIISLPNNDGWSGGTVTNGQYTISVNDADIEGNIILSHGDIPIPNNNYTVILVDANGGRYVVGMGTAGTEVSWKDAPGTNLNWTKKNGNTVSKVSNEYVYQISAVDSDLLGNITIKATSGKTISSYNVKIILPGYLNGGEVSLSGLLAEVPSESLSDVIGWKVKDTTFASSIETYLVNPQHSDDAGNIVICLEREDTRNYTVTLTKKVGNNTETTTYQNQRVGSYILLPTVEDIDDSQKFVGWKTKSGIYEELYQVSTKDVVNGSVTLAVLWSNESDSSDNYRIVYVSEYGTAPTQINVTAQNMGKEVKLSTVTTKDYRQIGWKITSGDNPRFIKSFKYTPLITDILADNRKEIIMEAVWAKEHSVDIYDESGVFTQYLSMVEGNDVDLDYSNPGWKLWNSNDLNEKYVSEDTYNDFVVAVLGYSLNIVNVVKITSTGVTVSSGNADGESVGGSWKIWNKGSAVAAYTSGDIHNGFVVLVNTDIEDLSNITLVRLVNTNAFYETGMNSTASLIGWKVSGNEIIRGGVLVPSEKEQFTLKYRANWDAIDYSIHVSQPANGQIDVYLEDRDGKNTVQHLTDEQISNMVFRYGDKLQISYTPDSSKVAFIKWIINGQHYIGNQASMSTTLIVQDDISISVDESTGVVIDFLIAFDNGNLDARDRNYTLVYAHDTVTDEYYEAKYVPNMVGMDHYTVKLPYGVNYELCLRYGWTAPHIDGTRDILPGYEVRNGGYEECVLVGNVVVVVGGPTQYTYDVISAGFIKNISKDVKGYRDSKYLQIDANSPAYAYLYDYDDISEYSALGIYRTGQESNGSVTSDSKLWNAGNAVATYTNGDIKNFNNSDSNSNFVVAVHEDYPTLGDVTVLRIIEDGVIISEGKSGGETLSKGWKLWNTGNIVATYTDGNIKNFNNSDSNSNFVVAVHEDYPTLGNVTVLKITSSGVVVSLGNAEGESVGGSWKVWNKGSAVDAYTTEDVHDKFVILVDSNVSLTGTTLIKLYYGNESYTTGQSTQGNISGWAVWNNRNAWQLGYTSSDVKDGFVILVDPVVTLSGTTVIELKYNYALTSGAGNPTRILDVSTGNAVVKVTKYVGISRSDLATLAARNLNINNSQGGTPPVVVTNDPNYKVTMYEGFPWTVKENGEDVLIFAIHSQLNLHLDEDTSLHPNHKFYLNWVRTDSPADIIIQMNSIDYSSKGYVNIGIQKQNDETLAYETIQSDIRVIIGSFETVYYYPLDVYDGYEVVLIQPSTGVGEDVHITADNKLYMKINPAIHGNTGELLDISVKYSLRCTNYTFNNTTFGQSGLSYDSAYNDIINNGGLKEWGQDIELPKKIKYNGGNSERDVIRWVVIKTDGTSEYIIGNENEEFVYKVTKSDANNTERFVLKTNVNGDYTELRYNVNDSNTMMYRINNDNKKIYDNGDNEVSIKFYSDRTCTTEVTATSIVAAAAGSTYYTDKRLLFTPLITDENVTFSFITNYDAFNSNGDQRLTVSSTAGGTMSDYGLVLVGINTVKDFMNQHMVTDLNSYVAGDYIFNGFRNGDELLNFGAGTRLYTNAENLTQITGNWKVWNDPNTTSYSAIDAYAYLGSDYNFVVIVKNGYNLNTYTLITITNDGASYTTSSTTPVIPNGDWKIWNYTKRTSETFDSMKHSNFVVLVQDGCNILSEYTVIEIDGSDTIVDGDRLYIASWSPNDNVKKTFHYTLNGDDATVSAIQDALNDVVLDIDKDNKLMPGTEITIFIQPKSGYTVDVDKTIGEMGYSLVSSDMYVDITTHTKPSNATHDFVSWNLWGNGVAVTEGTEITQSCEDAKNGFLVFVADWGVDHGDKLAVVFVKKSGATNVVNLVYANKGQEVNLNGTQWKVWNAGAPKSTTYTVSENDAIDGFILLVDNGIGVLSDYTLVYASEEGDSIYAMDLQQYYKDKNGSKFVKTDATKVYRYEGTSWVEYTVTDVSGKDGMFVKHITHESVTFKLTRDGTVYRNNAGTYEPVPGNTLVEFYTITPEYEYKNGNLVKYGTEVNVEITFYPSFASDVAKDWSQSINDWTLVYSKNPNLTYVVKNVNDVKTIYLLKQYGGDYDCIETSYLHYDGSVYNGYQFKDIFGNIWEKVGEEFVIRSVTVYTFDPTRTSEVKTVITFDTSGNITSGSYPAQYYFKDLYGNHVIGNGLVNNKVATLYLDANDDGDSDYTLNVFYIEQNEYTKALSTTDLANAQYFIKKNGMLVASDGSPVEHKLYHDSGCKIEYKGDYSISMTSMKYNTRTEVTENGTAYFKDSFGNKYENWLGTPTKLNGNRGYSWTFFLKDDLSPLTIYTKKVSYNINFIINGVKVTSTDLSKVSTIAPLTYTGGESYEFYGEDIPQYTIVAFDGPQGARDIVWYTDPAYTKPYDVHNGGVYIDPSEFKADVDLSAAIEVTEKTMTNWKLWGKSDEGYVVAPNGQKDLSSTDAVIRNDTYFYVFMADWGTGNSHGLTDNGYYKVIYVTNFGTIEADQSGKGNMEYVAITDNNQTITVRSNLVVGGVTSSGWKIWNSDLAADKYTIAQGGNSAFRPSDYATDDKFIILVADWGEDITNASNIVYASEWGNASSMQSVRKYQYLSNENISLYAHSGTYVLYLHDFNNTQDKTMKYELVADENNQITLPSEHYTMGDYIFVGWSSHTRESDGKRVYTYIPNEKVYVSALKDQTDLYPFYVTDGSEIKYYDGQSCTLQVTLDALLSRYEVLPSYTVLAQNIETMTVWYNDTKIPENQSEATGSTKAATHAGNYYVYYSAKILTPKGIDNTTSYGNTEYGYRFTGKAEANILKVDAYAIAPSLYAREEDGESITVTESDVTTIGLVPSDVQSITLLNNGTYGKTRSDVGVTPTRVVVVWTDAESSYAEIDYNLTCIDGSLVIYYEDATKHEYEGYA